MTPCPDLAGRTAPAKSRSFRTLAFQLPAINHSPDSFAGRAGIASTVFLRRGTIQILGNEQSESAFADTCRTQKDHCMRQTVLLNRPFQYLHCSSIAKKVLQVNCRSHSIYYPASGSQSSRRREIRAKTSSGFPEAWTTWILSGNLSASSRKASRTLL